MRKMVETEGRTAADGIGSNGSTPKAVAHARGGLRLFHCGVCFFFFFFFLGGRRCRPANRNQSPMPSSFRFTFPRRA